MDHGPRHSKGAHHVRARDVNRECVMAAELGGLRTNRSSRRPPRRWGSAARISPPASARRSIMCRPTISPGRSSRCGTAPSPGTWTTSWMARSRPSASFPAPSRCCPSRSSTSTASYARCMTRWSECRSSISPIPWSEASSASSRKRTPGSASAGLPPCERAIRSSIGSTPWWTTRAPSGRTRSSSSSPTSPASAVSTWCRQSRKSVSEAIVPLILARDRGLRIDRLTDARELLVRELTAHLAADRSPRRTGVLRRAQVRAGGNRRAAAAAGVPPRPPRDGDAARGPERAPDAGRRGDLRGRSGGSGLPRLQRARSGRDSRATE